MTTELVDLRNILQQNNEEFIKFIKGQPQADRKSIYIHLFNELFRIIAGNEFSKFQKILRFLLTSVENDPEFNFHGLHEENDCLWKATNLIILCCKFNRRGFLEELLMTNEAIRDILLKNPDGEFPLPTYKDEEQHNAFYYGIRNGNIKLIEILLEHWPGNYFGIDKTLGREKMAQILSDAQDELVLRNVPLSKEMRCFLNKKLLDLRLMFIEIDGKSKKPEGIVIESPEIQWEMRIYSMLKNIENILSEYADGKEFDVKFLFLCRSVAKDINFLKRRLKSTYWRIPWEEMEFVIIAFVLLKTTCKEINLFYSVVLRSKCFFEHLKYFAEKLRKEGIECLTHILPKFPRHTQVQSLCQTDENYQKLIDDFEEIRDAYSFYKINESIDLMLTLDPTDPHALLIGIRVLQEIGEKMKNTWESPNLSLESTQLLLAEMPKNIQKKFANLRNSFSQAHGLIKLSEMFENESNKENFVRSIQTDLKIVRKAIGQIIHNKQMDLMCLILNEASDAEDVDQYVKIVKMIESVDLNLSEFTMNEVISSNKLKIQKIAHDFEKVATALKVNEKFVEYIVELATKAEKEMSLSENEFVQARMALRRLSIRETCIDPQRVRVQKKLLRVSLINISISKRHISLHAMAMVMCNIIESIEEDIKKYWELNDADCIDITDEMKQKTANKTKLEELTSEVFFILGKRFKTIKTLDDLQYELCIKNSQKFFTKKRSPNGKLLAILYDRFRKLESLLKRKIHDQLLFKALEMLLLDIMSIMTELEEKFLFVNNLSYLDYICSTLTNIHLRNFIAHSDPLFDILPVDPFMLIQYYSEIMLEQYKKTDFKNKKIIIIADNINVMTTPAQYNRYHELSELQKHCFEALVKGNIDNVKKSILNGADIKAIDIKSRTALHYAASSGSLEVVKFVLSFDIDPNCKDLNGYTPLHTSIIHNCINITEYFLNNFKLDANIENKKMQSPLFLAAKNGCEDMIKLLLKHKFTFNNRDTCFDAAEYAILCRNSNAAIPLLEHSNNVNAEKKGGSSYLIAAAEIGILKLVQYLIVKGANVHHVNENGVSALHMAGLMGHYDVVKLLLEKGARPNIQCKMGSTPLIFACEGNNDKIINILLEYGADPTVTEFSDKNTALHMLCVERNSAGVRLLLQNADVDVNATKTNHTYPIHFAAEYGQLDIVELLIQAKAKVNVKTREKVTPLHYASFRGHLDIVQLLIENGAEMNDFSENAQYLDYLSVNPLQCAAYRGHMNIVEYLISNGAEVSSQITTYALELAAMLGHTIVVSYFLQKGGEVTSIFLKYAVKNISILKILLKEYKMDVNMVNSDGLSLLYFACINGNVKTVKYLIENGANIHLETHTDNKETAFGVAVTGNHIGVIEVLIQCGALIKCDPMVFMIPVLLKQNTIVLRMLLKKKCLSQEDIKTCLAISVSYDFIDIAFALLDEINFKEQKEFGKQLLFSAIKQGHRNITDTILSKGIDVNTIFNYSTELETFPLGLTVMQGSSEMTEFLIERGANVNATYGDGTGLLHYAVSKNSPDMVKILIDNGADILAEDNERRIAIELAVGYNDIKSVEFMLDTKKININHRTHDLQQSLLHIAAQQGHVDMTKLLYARGVDITARDFEGSMPIDNAARYGHIKIVDFYLEKGISVNGCRDDKESLMHVAAFDDQNSEMLFFLNSKGADLNQIADENSTPLEIAIWKGNPNIVHTLLGLGAICRPDVEFIETCTEEIFNQITSVRHLFRAVKENNLKEVQWLVKENQAQVNAKNDKNETVLVWASWKGLEEIVEEILESGADPNIRCKNNFTALHYAAKFGHFDIVKILLTHGAIFNIESTTGKTAIQFTENKEIEEILQTIESCFDWIKSKNNQILTALNQIKNLETLKAILRARNGHNKTIMLAAMRNYLPFIASLQQLKQTVSGIELEETHTYLYINERFSESIDFLKNVRKERSKLFGEDCPGNTKIDFKILTAVYKHRNYKEALELCNGLLDKQLAFLGEDSDDTLETSSLKGLILHRLGKNSEGLEILETVIKKREQLFGKEAEAYFDCLNYLALIHQGIGDHKAALGGYTASFEGLKKMYGEYSAHILPAENNIALALRSLGKYEDALKAFESVYNRRKKMLGETHSDTLRTLRNISETYALKGELGLALKTFEDLWEIQKETLGFFHEDTLRTQINIGMTMKQQMKFLSALRHLNEAVPKLAGVIGRNHPDIIEANELIDILTGCIKFSGTPNPIEFMTNVNCRLNKAIENGNFEEVKTVIKYGADVNCRDPNGLISLHFAARNNNTDIIEFLLQKAADPVQTSNKGNTALHTAASMGHTESVEVLLKYVKRNKESSFYEFINGQTKNGKMTALHMAAKGGFVHVVKVLLQNRAIFDLVNASDLKPLNLSTNEEIIRLLTACDEVFAGVRLIEKLQDLKTKENPEFVKIIASARNKQNKSLMELLMSSPAQSAMERMDRMKTLLELIQ